MTRDRYSGRWPLYPGWNFEGNVGYSTPEHRDAAGEQRHLPSIGVRSPRVAYSQLDLAVLGEDAEGDLVFQNAARM